MNDIFDTGGQNYNRYSVKTAKENNSYRILTVAVVRHFEMNHLRLSGH